MRVVSFNTNGIRVREHQLNRLKAVYDPDIIGIQESKVQDADFPAEMIDRLGYKAQYHGQKTHYGVALLSKSEAVEVSKGFPKDGEDAQRRLIIGRYRSPKGEPLTVINGYFPQGESRSHALKFPAKRRFYADLLAYLTREHDPKEALLVIGDMNVAPLDADVGIGADNAKRWLKTGKCSFLPEEREWLEALQSWGLQDSFRALKPEATDLFSWFDYRSRGFEREPKRGLRIDLVLATPGLIDCCTDVGIAYDVRAMEKPSDHCPVWAEFDF
ncbi:MAG: exodeoxyribonuclease III [Candidatus Thiodiazotropha sp. (ex Dulcina madagascariensis)]|nr:exodeoxyribonuclease III [Candidatus Thiodiazotropha sp. (ex Dulcina madagascariensis)]MCU7928685.1 exodeoxyribonuclease III [Candidatus Thiodiazotropha sp. (ex Dulcina madagascariensis)]